MNWNLAVRIKHIASKVSDLEVTDEPSMCYLQYPKYFLQYAFKVLS